MSVTAYASAEQSILDELARLGGNVTSDDDIVFEGTQLVVPERMTLTEAAKFLANKAEESEMPVSFSRVFQYRPWDGANAVQQAFKKYFGGLLQRRTIFQDAEMRDIPVDFGVTRQVPWGVMQVPLLPEVAFELSVAKDPEYGVLFRLNASGPKKFRSHIEGVFNAVQAELETNSIYRGKAFDGRDMPEFLDLGSVDPSKVIYSDDVTIQFEANVWSLLRHTDRMRELGIPLKRAVLFEGPYGTGKTLGAYLTAKQAVQNGWTFIYCRPGRDDLEEVMNTARLYMPAVVFFEDVDTVADPNEEANRVSKLLDIFDGIRAKNTELLCVLTTNHVEKLHKGMMRPGRLDAVIHVGALDVHGVERMAKAVLDPTLLDRDVNWTLVGEAMDGFLPAFVKEALDRTVRYAIARNGDVFPGILTTQDFIDAADGLRPQLKLMEDANEHPEKLSLDSAFKGIISEKMEPYAAHLNAVAAKGIKKLADSTLDRGDVSEIVESAINNTYVTDPDGDHKRGDEKLTVENY